MPWAKWDLEKDSIHSTMRDLPPEISDLPLADLEQLGYRPLVIEWPEDMIERFADLNGSAAFDIYSDGAVHQTFPAADFSVAAVRRELVKMMKKTAVHVLSETDWQVVRKMETGKDIDPDVAVIRQRQRDHVVWLEERIQALNERELVEFQWLWPRTLEHEMIDGTPTVQFQPPVLPRPSQAQASSTPPPPTASEPTPNVSTEPLENPGPLPFPPMTDGLVPIVMTGTAVSDA